MATPLRRAGPNGRFARGGARRRRRTTVATAASDTNLESDFPGVCRKNPPAGSSDEPSGMGRPNLTKFEPLMLVHLLRLRGRGPELPGNGVGTAARQVRGRYVAILEAIYLTAFFCTPSVDCRRLAQRLLLLETSSCSC
jgi:hypothetical protein